ncbi:MAG TPA: cytochrome c [Thermoanaerobaculia bacterium]|nr:cytochrome c [Thermoanaerobaculia bacterium]
MKRRYALAIVASILLCCTSCERAPATNVVERGRADVARGSYLVNGVGRCFWCHSPQNGDDPSSPEPATLGAGDILDEQIPVVAPNLTPDREAGIASWTDAELARAIRQGIARDGRRLRSDHPAAYYSVMSDADVRAVIAYLRSLRPIRKQLRRSAPSPGTLRPLRKATWSRGDQCRSGARGVGRQMTRRAGIIAPIL